MRRPVIAGNWKLYKTVKETVQFIEQLKPLVQDSQALRHRDRPTIYGP